MRSRRIARRRRGPRWRLGSGRPTPTEVIVVRVNGLSSGLFEDDLRRSSGRVSMFSTCPWWRAVRGREAAEALDRLERRGAIGAQSASSPTSKPEGSPHGGRDRRGQPRVVGLQIGYADLFEPFGIDRSDGVDHVRMAVRLAAGEAGSRPMTAPSRSWRTRMVSGRNARRPATSGLRARAASTPRRSRSPTSASCRVRPRSRGLGASWRPRGGGGEGRRRLSGRRPDDRRAVPGQCAGSRRPRRQHDPHPQRTLR